MIIINRQNFNADMARMPALWGTGIAAVAVEDRVGREEYRNRKAHKKLDVLTRYPSPLQ
jgi:hypothetical protein